MIQKRVRLSRMLLVAAMSAAVAASSALPANAESDRAVPRTLPRVDDLQAMAPGYDDFVILDQFLGLTFLTSVGEGSESIVGDSSTWSASGTRLLGGDLNDDGAGDVVIVRFVTGGFQIWGVPWDFATNSYGTDIMSVWALVTGGGFSFAASRQLMGDVTGDGLDDIVTIHKQSSGGLRAWVHRNTGSNSFAAPALWQTLITGGWSYDNSRQVLADVNGDGLMDLVSTHKQSTGGLRLWVHLSNRTSFGAPQLWSNLRTGGWSYENSRQVAGDFDGDSDWDIVSAHRQSSGGLRLWAHLSNGATSFGAPALWSDLRTGGWSFDNSQQVALDIDEDGADDIISAHRTSTNLYRLWMHFSTGSSFNAPQLLWEPDPTYLYDGTEFTASRN